MKIIEAVITPIAIPDEPLANLKDAHGLVFFRGVDPYPICAIKSW